MPLYYTKTGDTGKTSLFDAVRVGKDNLRIEAFGSVDELNSFIGVARSFCDDKEIDSVLEKIQKELFIVGADLAEPKAKAHKKISRITPDHVQNLEKEIDNLAKKIKPLQKFILPGGNLLAAHLQVTRAVCRRAERRAVILDKEEKLNNNVLSYLNRLSSLLFVLARYANAKKGTRELEWSN
ncbi:MAG: cob(I)yrinic acid a,c-diamide adenosyltransferase [Candidatus Nanoarchaeia archaeon]